MLSCFKCEMHDKLDALSDEEIAILYLLVLCQGALRRGHPDRSQELEAYIHGFIDERSEYLESIRQDRIRLSLSHRGRALD